MEGIELKISNPQKHFSQISVNNIKTEEEKKKLAQASKQFESLLTSLMLKSMTQTTEGLFGDNSYGGDSFESIFHLELANKISEGNGLGLANMIYKNLTGEDLPTEFRFSDLRIRPSRQINYSDQTNDIGAIRPSSESLNRLSRYENIIEEAAERYGLNKNLIKSVILAESAAREDAISSANAKGLMQIIDSTAEYLGIRNVWNPKENIFGGSKYLAELLERFNGDLRLALAGYNAGPANVEKYNGIPPFDETKSYVKRVIGYLNHFESNL
ncbi:MAG: transglycosylase SLT domain-containing protein [Ignavibacterium sp.]|nr:transglycosylase SLT domain-containing protein [Ignavibacterium sp.]MCX7610600.1 transglycosylase SLT domain-containing protein [Ignavibacterium sp.]MDW8374152.1 transglycosylase SLT domain-containing protein [Ignavibacteriales bacterium]